MLGPYGQCDPVPDRGEWCGILYDWIPRIFSTCSSDLWKRRTVKKYFVEERIRHPLCSFSRIVRWTALFTQSNQAILSCIDSKTGKVLMERTRLPGLSNVYASLVGAGNHVYVIGRYGKTAVLKRTGKFDLVTTNTLADRFDASPSVVGGQLFLRGHKFLYCIERE